MERSNSPTARSRTMRSGRTSRRSTRSSRRPGQGPPPESAPGPVIGLDLSIDAPRAVFVRGRGLDAETGGQLHVTGTSAAPRIAGGFDMRRGTFDLGGASLKFTSGKVSFT